MDPDRTGESGWYPDPCELAEVRYFDGAAWTDFVMTDGVPARVPLDDNAAALRGRPVDADHEPITGSVGDRVARPAADASGDRPAPVAEYSAAPRLTCATGPCDRPRVAGLSFCTKHAQHPALGRSGGRRRRDAPALQPKLVCPYCQTSGCVSTAKVKVSVGGVTPTKAATALFTAGLSLGITGLTNKERITRASCSNCGMTWRLV